MTQTATPSQLHNRTDDFSFDVSFLEPSPTSTGAADSRSGLTLEPPTAAVVAASSAPLPSSRSSTTAAVPPPSSAPTPAATVGKAAAAGSGITPCILGWRLDDTYTLPIVGGGDAGFMTRVPGPAAAPSRPISVGLQTRSGDKQPAGVALFKGEASFKTCSTADTIACPNSVVLDLPSLNLSAALSPTPGAGRAVGAGATSGAGAADDSFSRESPFKNGEIDRMLDAFLDDNINFESSFPFIAVDDGYAQ